MNLQEQLNRLKTTNGETLKEQVGELKAELEAVKSSQTDVTEKIEQASCASADHQQRNPFSHRTIAVMGSLGWDADQTTCEARAKDTSRRRKAWPCVCLPRQRFYGRGVVRPSR